MRKFMPFSPVEIAFSSSEGAMDYICKLTSGEITTLLMVSNGRIKELGLEKQLENVEKHNNVIHIEKIPSNPTIMDVYENLKLLQGKSINQIIAIGGGSCIDLAKSISSLLYLIPPDKLSEEAVRLAIKNKEYLTEHTFIDIIAIPTTSGTGSEVTRWATIWDMDQKEKLSIESVNCFPKVAILVPEYMISMPARLTLSTGLDALSHAIEAYWAKSRNPLSQALAISAIERIKEYLPKVLFDNRNLELREGMCTASLLAGLAFSLTRSTACHSISYPLTMYYGIEHGFAAALTLVQVAELNESVVPEINRIYSVFGGKSEFRQWMEETTRPVLDLKLSTFGITEADLDFIAEKTFTQGRMDNNPIVFTTAEVKDILLKAY